MLECKFVLNLTKYFILSILIFFSVVLYTVLAIILALVIFIIIINVMQSKKPHMLPLTLRTWSFLPFPLRSLEPYDKLMMHLLCCKKFKISPQNMGPIEKELDTVKYDDHFETKVIQMEDEPNNDKSLVKITSF